MANELSKLQVEIQLEREIEHMRRKLKENKLFGASEVELVNDSAYKTGLEFALSLVRRLR